MRGRSHDLCVKDNEMRLKTLLAMLAAATIFAVSGAGAGAADRTSPAPFDVAASHYGCYKVVNTTSLNIRARPFSDAGVIAVAKKGEVLKKWKRWCTVRGFWCPVEKGGLQGHADKNYLVKVDCPSAG